MKQRIENKLHEYIETLLDKPQLTCEEYLLLKNFYKELIAEEIAMRHAEARAQKINNMLDAKGENYELQKQKL